MKSLFLRSLYIILALISFSLPVTCNAQDFEGFNLSEDEKRKLDEELEAFVEAFNNLPPEKMRELEEINKQLEDEMREEGLDPSNLDHVLEWAGKKAEKLIEDEKEEAEKQETEQTPKEPIKPFEFKLPSAESDASTMLLNLVTYIAELRQKSISYDEMNKKLERFSSELNELSYFLHSLTNPDLMKHLLSKDFETLYKNLEAFYQILARQVPLIQSKELEETDIENPYQALGLNNEASMDDVEDAYQNLKEMFDATKIEEQLQKQNMPEQEIAKTIKQSKISFSFIQDAYDELKDPKQKAILDRKIREQAEKQRTVEKLSYQAFDEIYKVFTDKLFPILSDIKKLFEKYRPEEISRAKQYDEREKKLLAESKKPFKIIKGEPGRIKFKEKDGEYEEFYKHLAQKEKSFKAPSYKPLFDESYKPDFFGEEKAKPSAFEKPKGKEGGEKKPGKEDGKKEEKKKEEGKDGKKENEDKSKGASEKKPSSKEPEQLAEIGILAKSLENAAKKEKKVEVQRITSVPLRSAEGEAKAEVENVQIKLEDIKKGLNKYLTSSPTQAATKDQQLKDIEPLNDFLAFAKQNDIENIATGLKKLTPKPNEKIESEAVSKMLKDKILKHKPMIETWYNEFYQILSPSMRRETPNLAAIDINKQNIHRLGTKSTSKEDTDAATTLANKAKESFSYIPPENLYKVREFLKGMQDAIAAIEKALGVKSEPQKPESK